MPKTMIPQVLGTAVEQNEEYLECAWILSGVLRNSSALNSLLEGTKREPYNHYTINLETTLSEIEKRVQCWEETDEHFAFVQAIAMAKCKRLHFEENVDTKADDELRRMLVDENFLHHEIFEYLLQFMK